MNRIRLIKKNAFYYKKCVIFGKPCHIPKTTRTVLSATFTKTKTKIRQWKRFGARNQLRAARFVTVPFIGCSLNTMELVVRN